MDQTETALTPAQVKRGWELGILWWKLRPAQRRMYAAETASDALKWVNNCSRRLGKSFKKCLQAIEVCRQVPDGQARLIAPTQKQMRGITQPIIRKIIRDCPAELRPLWKQPDSLWLFPGTNAQLHVAGANNGHEDDSRGTEAHWIGIDEPGQIDKLKYLIADVLMPQLLTTRQATTGKFGKLSISGTPPPTPAHEFVDIAQEAEAGGNYSTYDIFSAGYSPEIIELFRKEANGRGWKPGDPDSTTWLREYLCKFVVDKNLALVPEWNETYLVDIPRDEFFRFYHLYNGMDLGVSDFTVCLLGYYDFRLARLVIEDEVVMNGPQMTTPLLAAAINSRRLDLWGTEVEGVKKMTRDVYRAVSDNDNPLLLQDLSRLHDVHFSPVVKDSLNAMVNAMRVLVGSGRLAVHSRCRQLAGCLRNGVWKDLKRKEWLNSGPEKFGHFDALAALMYLVRNLDMQTNPIPATLGLSESSHIINPEAFEQQGNAAAVRQIMTGGLGGR